MTQRTVLAGRYALVSPLGRGGMGQVWEGRDERLGRPVAVKLMTGDVLAGRAETDDLVRRFTREAAVTAGLEHPGVPAIYDAGEYDGGLFLVMELVDGCTISDLIAEHGPLPVPWVAGIGAPGAAGVGAGPRAVDQTVESLPQRLRKHQRRPPESGTQVTTEEEDTPLS